MGPEGVPWTPLGIIGGPLDVFLESLEVLLAAVGWLWDPLGTAGGPLEVPGRVVYASFGVYLGRLSR